MRTIEDAYREEKQSLEAAAARKSADRETARKNDLTWATMSFGEEVTSDAGEEPIFPEQVKAAKNLREEFIPRVENAA